MILNLTKEQNDKCKQLCLSEESKNRIVNNLIERYNKKNKELEKYRDCSSLKDGKFRDCHIEKVKQCLTIQLQIDEQVKDMNVKAWSLI